MRDLKALAGFEKSGHFFFNAPVGRGYDDGSKPQAEYNIAADVKAAQTVFKSGIPLQNTA